MCDAMCTACGMSWGRVHNCYPKPHPSSQRFHDILKELGELYDQKQEEEKPPSYVGAHNSRCGGDCKGSYYADPRQPCGCKCHELP